MKDSSKEQPLDGAAHPRPPVPSSWTAPKIPKDKIPFIIVGIVLLFLAASWVVLS